MPQARVSRILVFVVVLLLTCGCHAKSSGTSQGTSSTSTDVQHRQTSLDTAQYSFQSISAPTMATLNSQKEVDSLAFHRQEYERANVEIAELEKVIDMLQHKLDVIETDINTHWTEHTDYFDRITKSSLPSPRRSQNRNLRCMGWKKTSSCQWQGERDPKGDQPCGVPIVDNSAGYCTVYDEDTGEYFRVMRSDCSAITSNAYLSCEFAPEFANFPVKIEQTMLVNDNVESIANESRDRIPQSYVNGIILVVAPSQEAQAEALVLAVREYGCELPVELWSMGEENSVVMLATKLSNGASAVIARVMERKSNWYQARVHAIMHSHFDQVLYLDVSTIPLCDPTYLFSLPEFLDTGALFWPDLFHPGTTESNIQSKSLLWELLDIPFINMFEQDDRQLLIRRNTLETHRGLQLVDLFATHTPSFFSLLKLVNNNKDLFRLAWLKAHAPFSIITVPPSLVGKIFTDTSNQFCGSHVVQHDPNGNKVFLHRQVDADDSALHDTTLFLQSFEWRRDPTDKEPLDRLSVEEMVPRYQVTAFLQRPNDMPRCYAFEFSDDKRIRSTRWTLKR